ncbi:MAG: energy transducer TonB, partial [Bacteroidales bacterium]|nr:energy transducer TonB [Bacteroidales bacterium]
MKNQPVASKSETLEDMVFEGRNKAYGAYEMNRKRERTLLVSFFVTLLFATTAIAVPFINGKRLSPDADALAKDHSVTLIDIDLKKPKVPLPPIPEQTFEKMEKTINYTPVVVEEADPEDNMLIYDELVETIKNAPPDELPFVPVGTDSGAGIIDETDHSEPVLFPQEQASFMGGDVETFRNWVVENIQYPQEAIESNIFGRVVVQFCVNSKGEVVEIKLVRELDPLVDGETIRVISSSP